MLYSVVSTRRKWFDRSTRKGRTKISKAVQFVAEELEPRQMLSAQPGATLIGATLVVTGSAGSDTIVVGLNPGNSAQLQVTGAGANTETFTASKVRLIEINDLNGNDSVTVSANITSYITAGNGVDTIVGPAAGHSRIIAGNGSDTITSNGAYDYVTVADTSTNPTSVQANGAHTYVKVGAGQDTLVGSSGGYDSLIAGNGNDTITSNGPHDYVLAGNGFDLVTLNGAHSYASVGNGDDTLVGSSGGYDTLFAGKGSDSLTGNGQYDYLLAGAGNDTLVSGPGGHSHLQAGAGNDSLTSNGPYDYLLAGNGNDTLTASSAHDTLIAGTGKDSLSTTGSYDYLYASSGKDTLDGGSGGHNTLISGNGTDSLQDEGGTGNWLQAGSGNDTMTGGSADTYHYSVGVNMVSTSYGASSAIKTLKAHAALPNVAAAKTLQDENDIAFPNNGTQVIDSPFSTVGDNDIDSIEAAYSIPDPTQAGDLNGAGETIAIVDAYGPTPAEVTSDLNFFSLNPPLDDSLDAASGTVSANSDDEILAQSSVPLLGNPTGIFDPTVTLPTPTTSSTPNPGQFTFNVVLATPNGQTPTVDPATAADQAAETDLDVEWAHAIAPQARIMLFEANSLAVSDLMFAVNQAALFTSAHGGGVVSMSFGGAEFAGENQFDTSIFGNPAYKSVSFIAASGDTGAEASFPALSSFVTSVGGTTLLKNYVQVGTTDDGFFPWLEYPWAEEGAATSTLEPIPNGEASSLYGQVSGTIEVPPGSPDLPSIGQVTGGFRAGPDVVMLADPATGVAEYNTANSNVPGVGLVSGWSEVGGTSLAAPLFAGVVALANQARGQEVQAGLVPASDANGDHTLGAELNGALYFLNNTEFEEAPAVVNPGTDLLGLETLNAPIIGGFQVRGEVATVGDIGLPAAPPVGPAAEAVDTVNSQGALDASTGLFYDIGGAPQTASIQPTVTFGADGDANQGTIQNAVGGEVTGLDWDPVSGLGSPNVNELVYPNLDTNPMTTAALGETIAVGSIDNAGTVTLNGSGEEPSLNLANVNIDLDTLRVLSTPPGTTPPGTGTGTGSKITGTEVNIPNIKLSATFDLPNSVDSGGIAVFEVDPGANTNTFAMASAGTNAVGAILATFGFDFDAQTTPAQSGGTLSFGTEAAPTAINLNGNGTFGQVVDLTLAGGIPATAGEGNAGIQLNPAATPIPVFIQGTITNGGLSISGSFYRVAVNAAGTVQTDANGNPIPWINVEGRGGNLTGSFTT